MDLREYITSKNIVLKNDEHLEYNYWKFFWW